MVAVDGTERLIQVSQEMMQLQEAASDLFYEGGGGK